MDGTYEIKKYSADKIALLGLFAVALLIARLIVIWRSVIVLSGPITLSCADLSVSMPAGNGWRSEKQWRYQENGFTLSSVFDPGSGPIAQVSCRYLLAAAKTTPDTLFKQKASAVHGTIAKTEQIRTGTLTIDWVHIKEQETLFDMFFGTAQLPNNRQLDIEVHQTMGDTDLAEQVFKRIIEGLEFKNNHLLEAGSEIIAEIKSKGLDSFLEDQSQEVFFLIKNARGRTIGFMMNVLINSEPDAQLNIQAAGFFYIADQYARKRVTSFQSDNSFDNFVARSETSSLAGRSGAELILKKGVGLTVKRFTKPAEEKIYQLSPAAIPDVFDEQLFSQLLDRDHRKIIVDIIEANGTIMPVHICRIETEDIGVAGEQAAYVLKVELLDGQGFFEQVYFDDQKRIFKRVIWHGDKYILESATEEEVLRQFPKQANYILQKNKMLE